MEATPPPIKKANSVKSTSSTKNETSTKGSTPSRKVADGDIIEFDGFGGEVETQEGVKTTLKELGASLYYLIVASNSALEGLRLIYYLLLYRHRK